MADDFKPQIARDPDLERAGAWWKSHGRGIVAGVALGLTAVVGINGWQHYRETQAESASLLFARLQEVVADAIDEADGDVDGNVDEGDAANAETDTDTDTDADTDTETETATETEGGEADDAISPIEQIAGALMADYRATPYAVHGAFALAKFLLDKGDLDRSAETLRWAVDNAKDDTLRHIAILRLAAVLLAQGHADEVLELVTTDDAAGFAPRYHELEGDAHLLNGDLGAARSAYRLGLTRMPPNAAEQDLLQLKLDNVGK